MSSNSRKVIFRRQKRLNRRQGRVQLIDNKDILNRITTLPRQNTCNPMINEFFNGTSFF